MFADTFSLIDALPPGVPLAWNGELALFLGGLLLVLATGAIAWVEIRAYQAWVQAEARREGIYRKRFTCPSKGRDVEVEFLTPMWEPDNLLEVVSCSACTPRGQINCNRACLHWPQARKAHPLFPPPVPFPLFL
jgi:hypothetical protein